MIFMIVSLSSIIFTVCIIFVYLFEKCTSHMANDVYKKTSSKFGLSGYWTQSCRLQFWDKVQPLKAAVIQVSEYSYDIIYGGNNCLKGPSVYIAFGNNNIQGHTGKVMSFGIKDQEFYCYVLSLASWTSWNKIQSSI